MGTGKARLAHPVRRANSGDELAGIFERLRSILREHEGELVVSRDGPGDYYLDTRLQIRGQPLFFGAAQIRKQYVSYHLFPVYMFPDLVEEMSPALRKRMQGKSCFNLKRADEELFDELTRLTRRGFEELRRRPLPA